MRGRNYCFLMNVPFCFFAESNLRYVIHQATPEAIVILICLMFFSLFAWSTMIFKALQMNRARKLNLFFDSEFRSQPNVLGIFDRKLQVEGCPMFTVYEQGCIELDSRLKGPEGNPTGVGAALRLFFGEKAGPVREIHAGSGYWSQDSSVQVLGTPETPTRIWVRWPGGKTVMVDLAPNAREIEVVYR